MFSDRLSFAGIFLIVFFSALPLYGYELCFQKAAMDKGISPLLLSSVCKWESKLQPRALNWNKNGTYDFGLCQINSGHYKDLGHALLMQLGDPCTNIKVAADILADCISKHGYTWRAVGCYNAGSKDTPKYEHKRQQYAWLIYRTMKNAATR